MKESDTILNDDGHHSYLYMNVNFAYRMTIMTKLSVGVELSSGKVQLPKLGETTANYFGMSLHCGN